MVAPTAVGVTAEPPTEVTDPIELIVTRVSPDPDRAMGTASLRKLPAEIAMAPLRKTAAVELIPLIQSDRPY
jgi:hypothetical protein